MQTWIVSEWPHDVYQTRRVCVRDDHAVVVHRGADDNDRKLLVVVEFLHGVVDVVDSSVAVGGGGSAQS